MESGGEISAIPFRHREPRSGASPGEGAAGQPMPRRSTASRLVGRRRNDREAFGGDLRSYGVWRVMPSLRMRETSVLRFIPSRTAAPPGPVGRGAAVVFVSRWACFRTRWRTRSGMSTSGSLTAGCSGGSCWSARKRETSSARSPPPTATANLASRNSTTTSPSAAPVVRASGPSNCAVLLSAAAYVLLQERATGPDLRRTDACIQPHRPHKTGCTGPASGRHGFAPCRLALCRCCAAPLSVSARSSIELASVIVGVGSPMPAINSSDH